MDEPDGVSPRGDHMSDFQANGSRASGSSIAVAPAGMLLDSAPSADLRPAPADACGTLVGRSRAMLDVYRRIRLVAGTPATVFATGETGTGKELVARAVHDLSDRRHGAFVALNCGAVAPQLIESELFGHERGSFTGANRRHHGVFAQAHNGTLFLDEITEMDVDLQVRLLRVLETGTFCRIGAEQATHTNARIVAASNQDPLAAVRAGRLRADLYYRLHVFPIWLPPLRDRGDDIGLLANHFLATLNRQSCTRKRFDAKAVGRLQAMQWPGNVRELANCVYQAFLTADDVLEATNIESGARPDPTSGDSVEVSVGMSVAAAEQALILATLVHCKGNKRCAARVLGLSLKTLYVRLNLYAAVATGTD